MRERGQEDVATPSARQRSALSDLPELPELPEPPGAAERVGRLHAIGSRLRVLLAHPAAVWVIIGASLLACAPAVVSGFILDDNFHGVALRDSIESIGSKRAPWDAFSFAKSPELTRRMIDESLIPWWSDVHARLSFLRPLTSLTLWVDYQLWPQSPVLMHLHSLVWYAFLLFAISRVYQRFAARLASSARSTRSNGVGFAGLALLIYALDDARAMSVGWLANRSALIALMIALAALLAHDRFRTTGRRRFLVEALGLLGVALLCAESALQAVGYLVAYALFLDPGTKKQRWQSLVPYAVLIAAWRAVYVLLGYGAVGSGLYIDPARNPLVFLEAALQRLPILLAAQFAGLSADLGDLLKYAAPELGAVLLVLVLLALGICLWLFYPLWRSRREVRFWAVGTLLSTIPVCAVAPADRLLVATGIGGSALVAIALLAALDRVRELSGGARRFFTGVLAFVNLGVAPLVLPMQAYALVYFDDYIGRAEQTLPAGAGIADKTVVLLNVPSDEYGIYMAHHRLLRGGVMPKHLRWLATSDTDLLVSRLDDNTLQVRPREGFLPPGSLWTLRSRDYRSTVGESLQLEGVRFTVTDVTADGRPAEVRVRFDQPLDSPDFVWMQWGNAGGFVPFKVPAPGSSVLVPAVDSRSVLRRPQSDGG